MLIFLFKLIGTPLLLACATLAARRWGQMIGGLIIGLPLVSGPISVFLAIENGAAFAVQTTFGSFVGTAALAVFALVYSFACRFGIGYAVVFGLISYSVSAWGFAQLDWGIYSLCILTIATLGGALLLAPTPPSAAVRSQPPKYDLLMRMGMMATLNIAITLAAPFIGSTLTGIAATFPYMALTMSIFGQLQGSFADAQRVMKGLITGLFSGCAFYLTVNLVLTDENLLQGYLVATAVTLAVQLVVLLLNQYAKKFFVWLKH